VKSGSNSVFSTWASTVRSKPFHSHRGKTLGRIIDRYQVKTDAASGIMNDPNDWSEDPRYIIDLLRRIVTVSLETMKIVDRLPALDIIEWPSRGILQATLA
jgi:hypothetical protein